MRHARQPPRRALLGATAGSCDSEPAPSHAPSPRAAGSGDLRLWFDGGLYRQRPTAAGSRRPSGRAMSPRPKPTSAVRPWRPVRQVAGWFDEGMNRVSGWYRRQTQLIIFVIGAIVAGSLNASTVHVVQDLWGAGRAVMSGAVLRLDQRSEPAQLI